MNFYMYVKTQQLKTEETFRLSKDYVKKYDKNNQHPGLFVSKNSVDRHVINLGCFSNAVEKEETRKEWQFVHTVGECCVSCVIDNSWGWEWRPGDGLILQLLRSIHFSNCEHTSHSPVC